MKRVIFVVLGPAVLLGIAHPWGDELPTSGGQMLTETTITKLRPGNDPQLPLPYNGDVPVTLANRPLPGPEARQTVERLRPQGVAHDPSAVVLPQSVHDRTVAVISST